MPVPRLSWPSAFEETQIEMLPLTGRAWASVKRKRSRQPNWKYYGGVGIYVCERWSVFETFLADMGEPPPGHSIVRINPWAGYTPENCRWATPSEQRRNQRRNYATESGLSDSRPEAGQAAS